VNANQHNLLFAGYHIKLPREIKELAKESGTCRNVQTADNACFAWSALALRPAKKNVERESLYPHYTSVLNLASIEFSMTLSQIKIFETLNDISINVYTNKKGNVLIRLADRKRSKHMNLLYVEDDNARHFALIKNLSRLVNLKLSRKKKYFCDRYVKILL